MNGTYRHTCMAREMSYTGKASWVTLFVSAVICLSITHITIADYLVDSAPTIVENPHPSESDWFGHSLATLSESSFVVGVPQYDGDFTDEGIVYAFENFDDYEHPSLMITNPLPSAYASFGRSLLTIGTNRIVIGAPQSGNDGCVFVYDQQGILLTTITNPSPLGEMFGESIASINNETILIGDPYDDTGAENAGQAYLFDLSGNLLQTITNPTPAMHENFSIEVASDNKNTFYIGSPVDDLGGGNLGSIYIYNTNGIMNGFITNHAPMEIMHFGDIISAFSGGIAVGSPDENNGCGQVYLYSSSGNLVTNIANPHPGDWDRFGQAICSFGCNKLLIGAVQDSIIESDAGMAYLFDISGNHLLSITNGSITSGDAYGSSFCVLDQKTLVYQRSANR